METRHRTVLHFFTLFILLTVGQTQAIEVVDTNQDIIQVGVTTQNNSPVHVIGSNPAQSPFIIPQNSDQQVDMWVSTLNGLPFRDWMENNSLRQYYSVPIDLNRSYQSPFSNLGQPTVPYSQFNRLPASYGAY